MEFRPPSIVSKVQHDLLHLPLSKLACSHLKFCHILDFKFKFFNHFLLNLYALTPIRTLLLEIFILFCLDHAYLSFSCGFKYNSSKKPSLTSLIPIFCRSLFFIIIVRILYFILISCLIRSPQGYTSESKFIIILTYLWTLQLWAQSTPGS